MAYCPKCGNEVDEGMAFCSRCGASLTTAAKVEQAPVSQMREKGEKAEKQEKQEKQEPEKAEKQEKGEYGFAGWLVGGLILILIGFFAMLRISNIIPSETSWALVLLAIGIIIIIVAVYFAIMARKQHPPSS